MTTMDPLALIRAQRGQFQVDLDEDQGEIRPATRSSFQGMGNIDLLSIPMRPNQPGWKDKIPPPEPDGISAQPPPSPAVVAADPVAEVAAAPLAVRHRIVVGFGPREGMFIVAVEEAPEWDVITSVRADRDEVIALLPILRTLAKVKDMTGGDLPTVGSA